MSFQSHPAIRVVVLADFNPSAASYSAAQAATQVQQSVTASCYLPSSAVVSPPRFTCDSRATEEGPIPPTDGSQSATSGAPVGYGLPARTASPDVKVASEQTTPKYHPGLFSVLPEAILQACQGSGANAHPVQQSMGRDDRGESLGSGTATSSAADTQLPNPATEARGPASSWGDAPSRLGMSQSLVGGMARSHDLVARLEALRAQLFHVSGTLAGVQARTAALSASLADQGSARASGGLADQVSPTSTSALSQDQSTPIQEAARHTGSRTGAEHALGHDLSQPTYGRPQASASSSVATSTASTASAVKLGTTVPQPYGTTRTYTVSVSTVVQPYNPPSPQQEDGRPSPTAVPVMVPVEVDVTPQRQQPPAVSVASASASTGESSGGGNLIPRMQLSPTVEPKSDEVSGSSHPFELGSPTGRFMFVALPPPLLSSGDEALAAGGQAGPAGMNGAVSPTSAAVSPASRGRYDEPAGYDADGETEVEAEESASTYADEACGSSDGGGVGSSEHDCGSAGTAMAAPPPPQSAAAVGTSTYASAFVRQHGSPVLHELLLSSPRGSGGSSPRVGRPASARSLREPSGLSMASSLDAARVHPWGEAGSGSIDATLDAAGESLELMSAERAQTPSGDILDELPLDVAQSTAALRASPAVLVAEEGGVTAVDDLDGEEGGAKSGGSDGSGEETDEQTEPSPSAPQCDPSFAIHNPVYESSSDNGGERPSDGDQDEDGARPLDDPTTEFGGDAPGAGEVEGFALRTLGRAARGRGRGRPHVLDANGGGGDLYDGYSEDEDDTTAVRMAARDSSEWKDVVARLAAAGDGPDPLSFSFPPTDLPTALAASRIRRPVSAGGSARSSSDGGISDGGGRYGSPVSAPTINSAGPRARPCRIVVPSSSPRSSLNGGWAAMPSPIPSPYTHGVIGIRTPSSGGSRYTFSLRQQVAATVSACLFGSDTEDEELESAQDVEGPAEEESQGLAGGEPCSSDAADGTK